MSVDLLTDLVRLGKRHGANDLHLESGSPALFRVRGNLMSQGNSISPEILEAIARTLIGSAYWTQFLERKSHDLSETIAGVRCRINCFFTRKGLNFSIRLLSSYRNSVRDCNLHPDLVKLVKPDHGLVIVSGPTGSGKSTTLSALIEEINSTENAHILTIENPIEYYFQNRKSFIRQRELYTHTPSFEQAIKDSMREDPDVLVISEMRDTEVMRLTLNAAETGHLVLTTLHASNSTDALNRLCMSFASDIQPSIRAQIADCLVAIVSQRLVYNAHEKIQIPCLEILWANHAVRGAIRSGAFNHVQTALQTGAEDGMYTFDRYRKWMEGKPHWVNPNQAPPLPESTWSSALKIPMPTSKTLSRSRDVGDVSRGSSLRPERKLSIEMNDENVDLVRLAKDLE